MNKHNHRLYLTWNDVMQFVEDVATKYKHEKFTGVFGPPRGGCILAVLLSHRLDIPMLSSAFNNCLIVDDVCDTGDMLQKYSRLHENRGYTIATMCYKPQSIVIPDYHKLDVPNDTWIVFPWELEPIIKEDLENEEN